MATLTATGAQSFTVGKYLPTGVFSMSTLFNSVVSAGDVIQLVKVPSGFQVGEIKVGASMSAVSVIVATVTIGDESDANRHSSASLSQTALFFSLGQDLVTLNNFPFTYSQEDTIDLSVVALTGSGTNNSPSITIGIVCFGSVDNQ